MLTQAHTHTHIMYKHTSRIKRHHVLEHTKINKSYIYQECMLNIFMTTVAVTLLVIGVEIVEY